MFPQVLYYSACKEDVPRRFLFIVAHGTFVVNVNANVLKVLAARYSVMQTLQEEEPDFLWAVNLPDPHKVMLMWCFML